ncbi:SRPBCC family protein [Mangrovibacterium diazotrophicum]|uniref:Polyketide cyclase/dehydrase/lipid transport protein n=1 Tax=Mangrovibacterium diazotrophicum TaxID=1261403 RepID=A0A419W8P4_9BACT|nr:SRPBCC family protein [Mangrovibacterium diazotrophicum]RKD91804.1 polyketide cyclase/dehydrase/lipid transport protein [Mangrovibacterium diazotrophicum]
MQRKYIYLLLPVFTFAGIGLLLPREVKVERSVRINAPIESVFQQVSDLRSWDEWSGLMPTDSAMNLEFLHDAKADTGYCWLTKEIVPQKRRLLVTGTAWCDSLSAKMSFDKDDIASSCFHFSEQDGTTVVRWEFRKKLDNNLIGAWAGPFIHNIVAPDLAVGLNRLKSVSEEKEHDRQISELQTR